LDHTLKTGYYPRLLPNETLARGPSPSRPRRPSRKANTNKAFANVDDRVALSVDLIRLIWQHKLWWAVPLLLALLVLGVLLVLEATPVGPLLYPLL
jgi:hypothetical protein